ncbi:tetratricopeptide repeat protein [Pseudorhodoferax soli]|nr:tetratricopeptide repeat protein [Pseudorhodoferax soli]
MRHALLAACVALACAAQAEPAPSAQAQAQAQALYAQARHYAGVTGQVVDLAQAHAYLRQAAERGHVQAQVDLGYLYLDGNAQVPKDPAAAFHWFRTAAGHGAVPAQCMLGDFYANGWGGARKDAAEALRWYRRSAATDAPCASRAQYALYRAYADGAGVRRDMPAAIAWLQQAAEAGNPRAQRALGRAYDRGEGVARDPALARVWLRKSREGVAPHDDHEHDMPSFAGPLLFKKLAPFSPPAREPSP